MIVLYKENINDIIEWKVEKIHFDVKRTLLTEGEIAISRKFENQSKWNCYFKIKYDTQSVFNVINIYIKVYSMCNI